MITPFLVPGVSARIVPMERLENAVSEADEVMHDPTLGVESVHFARTNGVTVLDLEIPIPAEPRLWPSGPNCCQPMLGKIS